MAIGAALIEARADTRGFMPQLARQLKAALKGYVVSVKVQPDTKKFGEDLSRQVRQAVRDASVNAPGVRIRADITGLAVQLERELRIALRALPPQTVRVKVEVDTASLGNLVASSRVAARAIAQPFEAAAVDIGAAMQAAAAAGATATERIAAAADRSAASLAKSYGLAAGVIPQPFREAGVQIGRALSAGIASGETSLIRLEQTAQRTAKAMQGSLGRAAAAAKVEIQGELRQATDAVVADLVKLARSGRINFADVDTAGRIAAEKIAVQFRQTGAISQQAIAAAAAKISADLEAAARNGGTALTGLQAAAARSALAVQRDFARAAAEARYAVDRMTRQIEEDFAKIQAASGRTADKMAHDFRRAAIQANRAMDGLHANSIAKLEQIAAKSTLVFGGIVAGAGAIGAATGAIGTAAFVQIEQIEVGLQGIFAGKAVEAAEAAAAKSGTKIGKAMEESIVKEGQEAGTAFFKELQQFAKFTPFELPEIATAAQKFTAALRLDAQQTINVLTDVGNAIATVAGGKEGSERLNRIAIAIGQISSYGKLTADNLNQISNALPTFQRQDLYENLVTLVNAAGKETISYADAVERATNGEIDSKLAIEAILKTMREIPGAGKQMVTTADGITKALDAMERQSLTLGAQISQFKDAVRIGFTDSFRSIAPAVDDAIDSFQDVFIGGLDALVREGVGPLIESLSPVINEFMPVFVQTLIPLINLFGDLATALAPAGNAIFQTFGAIVQILSPSLILIAEAFSGALVEALPQIIPAFQDLALALAEAAPAVAALVQALVPLIPILVTVMVGILNVLAPILVELAPVIQAVAEAFLRFLQLPGVAEVIGSIVVALALLSAVLGPVISAVATVAPIFAALNGVLGAVIISFGPMILAILAGVAAFAAIAGGVIYAYVKFEKFRDTVDRIILGLVYAFDFLVNRVLDSLDFIISGGAKAFGWIPGIGDKLKEANRQFDAFKEGVNDALDGIEKSLTIRINADGSQAKAEIYDVQKQLGKLAALRAGDLTGYENAAPLALPTINTSVVGGGYRPPATDAVRIPGSGGATGSLKDGDEAAKAAKTRAEKFADTIKKIVKDLNSDLRKTLVSDSAEKIADTIKSLGQKIADAYEEAGKKRPNALLKRLAEDSRELQGLARELKTLNDKIKAATDKAASIAKTVAGFANITSLGLPTESKRRDKSGPAILAANARAYQSALNDRLIAIKKFAADLQKLTKANVNKNIIEQLASAGVESGGAVAAALARGDKATLAAISKTQTQIDAASKSIGDKTADFLFDAGKNAGKGFLTGLQSERAAIIKEMGSIADALIAKIKSSLKIKSPSGALFDIGALTGQGLEGGLKSRLRNISTAAQQMASAAVPVMAPADLGRLQDMASTRAFAQLGTLATSQQASGTERAPVSVTFGKDSIVVSGVSDAETGKRVGLALGEGILHLLAGQQQSAALAGFGG